MNTISTLHKKTQKKNLAKITISQIRSNELHKIESMTKGWQCCKCKETMYRDEDYCNWDRCRHRRCSSCRSFQV